MLIPTNIYLTKLKLTDYKLCTFCKLEAETIEHLFVYFPYVKEILNAVKDLFLNKFNISITLNETNILCGKFNSCNTYKVLVIKHYIFFCKYNSTKKINNDALLNVITERILLRNTYCYEMAKMSRMKITGEKIVTFLIICEQSHTRNSYFD